MKGGPTPGEGRTPDPLGGDIYRVSYRSVRGETFSRLFRQAIAAERFAINALHWGADVRVHYATVSRWRELPVCRYCHAKAGPHTCEGKR